MRRADPEGGGRLRRRAAAGIGLVGKQFEIIGDEGDFTRGEGAGLGAAEQCCRIIKALQTDRTARRRVFIDTQRLRLAIALMEVQPDILARWCCGQVADQQMTGQGAQSLPQAECRCWCADFVSLGRGGQIFGQQGEQVLQCAHQQAGFARNGEACSAEQRDLRVDKEHGAGENPPGFRPAERRVNQGLVQGAQPVVQFGRFFLGVDRGALLQTRDQRPQTFTRAGRCQSLVFAASFFHVGRKYESLSPFMVSIAVSLFVWGVLFLTVRSCSGSKVQNISLFFRAFLI